MWYNFIPTLEPLIITEFLFACFVVELLEQRQENAAALKLKSERVGGMVDAEVTRLRNEIKVP